MPSSHTSTVVRKLPTMMPTDVVIATAVASAATSTDVRRSEPERLRAASSASTPSVRPSRRDEREASALTRAGMASPHAATPRTAAR